MTCGIVFTRVPDSAPEGRPSWRIGEVCSSPDRNARPDGSRVRPLDEVVELSDPSVMGSVISPHSFHRRRGVVGGDRRTGELRTVVIQDDPVH